jgi:hypothetical protein
LIQTLLVWTAGETAHCLVQPQPNLNESSQEQNEKFDPTIPASKVPPKRSWIPNETWFSIHSRSSHFEFARKHDIPSRRRLHSPPHTANYTNISGGMHTAAKLSTRYPRCESSATPGWQKLTDRPRSSATNSTQTFSI